MQNILFGFRVKPTNNWLGTDGSGDAVSIYEDGTIQYDHFHFGSDVPISSETVRKDRTIAKEIQTVLTKYKKDIEHIPVDIDNGTYDGAWYIFTFYDKIITIDNPSRYKDGDMIFVGPDAHHYKEGGIIQLPKYYAPPYDPQQYYEELREHLVILPYYNNTLLDIRDEVSAILAQYDLPLLKHV